MKDEIERLKDELYQVNVKVKKAESQQDILKRDHQDEINHISQEITDKNKVTQEDLHNKHNKERNILIQESNKSDDEKFIALQKQHEQLLKEKEQLEDQLKKTIEEMNQKNEELQQKLKEESGRKDNDESH